MPKTTQLRTYTVREGMYWASPAREAMNLAPDEYLVHTDDRTVETVDLKW
jgi:hypothetical protein